MRSLSSQRERRTSGPENFQSSAKKDFFNNIRHKRPIRNGRLGVIKGQDGFEAMVFGSLQKARSAGWRRLALADGFPPLFGNALPEQIETAFRMPLRSAERVDEDWRDSTISAT